MAMRAVVRRARRRGFMGLRIAEGTGAPERYGGTSLVLLEVEKRNEDEGVVFGDEAGAGLKGDVAEDVEERDLVEV